MALVFKIKFEDNLRRWLVSENFSSTTFSLTLGELEDKIRELFHLSPTASLVITYVDKDNDVVTLGDDQDLVDACVVQQLNPLRLDVLEKRSAQEPTTIPSSSAAESANVEVITNPFLPKAMADNIQNVVKAATQAFDPKNFAGLISGKVNGELVAGGLPSLGLGSIISPVVVPHAPVLTNLRAHDDHHVFHRGVQCDCCGMNPIEGPRYKSTKVPNYDLCFRCYDLIGTEADFEKLEHPINPLFHSQMHSSFLQRGLRSPAGRPSFRRDAYGWMPECPFSGQAMDSFPFNDYQKNFDAKFVKDVTVLDKTELEPGTKFTKIWRLANNGTLPWPQGTQFMHSGGDALSSMEVVTLELPDGGLPCGQDVEISVDLTAPDVVGRYVSYWHLLLPSGEKFGHTVWVAIQVISQLDGSTKEDESFANVIEDINHGQELHEAYTVSSKLTWEKGGSSDVTDMHEDVYGIGNDEGKQPGFDTEDKDGIVNEGKSGFNTETDIELDGFSLVEKPVEIIQLGSGVERQSPLVEKETTETYAEAQLQLLESMGFVDRERNLYWLKKNNESLQGAVEDLLLCAGWEGIMRNLKEMGFTDHTTNIRLLHKHNGSIKLVVKDLVKMENQKE